MNLVEAKPKILVRIAVLDTGYTPGNYSNVNLCNYGHKDFTGTGLQDHVWHGSHIANMIADRITDKDSYCIIIVKWYDPLYILKDTTKLFEYTERLGVDVINYSAGGHYMVVNERQVLTRLLNKGIKVFVAAGNDNNNLDERCDFYPPCLKLPKLRVVGNLSRNGKRSNSSNYGSVVTDWEWGEDIVADTPGGPVAATGTSQATAQASAKAANELIYNLKNKK